MRAEVQQGFFYYCPGKTAQGNLKAHHTWPVYCSWHRTRPWQWTNARLLVLERELLTLTSRKLASPETLDHPDIRYDNYPLKLKWRYLFRIMVYTYCGTYLCMNFKHYVFIGGFFFKQHLLEQKFSDSRVCFNFIFESSFPENCSIHSSLKVHYSNMFKSNYNTWLWCAFIGYDLT